MNNSKDKKLFRNYTCDDVAMYRDVYNALSAGFDELQKDSDGVLKSDMIKYIMKKTKGSVNPMKLEMILSEFEK